LVFPTNDRDPRRLAASLAADVAGYSRLMGAEHHGRIVKTTGDGLLVEIARSMPCAAASKGITEL
jgi:adenylate cyclase